MRLENRFDVPAPIDEAWALLTDVPRVVPCMPGAQLTNIVDDEHWEAQVHVKLGPISMKFAADVSRQALEPGSYSTTLVAKARELKGRGGAESTIESSLVPSGDGTTVTVITELSLNGAVAQYGRGIVSDVSDQLVKQFAANLAAELERDRVPAAATPDGAAAAAPRPARAPAPAVKPVGGLKLFLRALFAPILRVFTRR
jgi:carbon monoxide dehydrogenase subunit G